MESMYILTKPLPKKGYYYTSEDPGDSIADFDGKHRLDEHRTRSMVFEIEKFTQNFHAGISFIAWDSRKSKVLRISDVVELTKERFLFEEYFVGDMEKFPGYFSGIDYNI